MCFPAEHLEPYTMALPHTGQCAAVSDKLLLALMGACCAGHSISDLEGTTPDLLTVLEAGGALQ